MIRKVYLDLIKNNLRENGYAWLCKRSWQYVLIHLSQLFHRPLCGPALGSIMVTYRCNLHCQMCDMPHKASLHQQLNENEFTTHQFKEIIHQFAKLGTPGIGFTGGEPLLRKDIFELLAETRRHGMVANLNTNGLMLDDVAAQKIISTDIDSVNISLDGATPVTHDRIRRSQGAFVKTVDAISRLAHYKRKYDSRLRIKTVTVLNETNIDEIPQILKLGRQLCADCVEIIPQQFFSDQLLSGQPPSDIHAKIDALLEYLQHDKTLMDMLENSPAHLKLFKSSFAALPSPIRCSAGYNSLAVDCYGNVFPCVPWINRGKISGNIREESLFQLWKSVEYQQQREETVRCRDCYLNCQTELNLLFDL